MGEGGRGGVSARKDFGKSMDIHAVTHKVYGHTCCNALLSYRALLHSLYTAHLGIWLIWMSLNLTKLKLINILYL